jgi:hypothetical protein
MNPSADVDGSFFRRGLAAQLNRVLGPVCFQGETGYAIKTLGADSVEQRFGRRGQPFEATVIICGGAPLDFAFAS